MDGGVHLRITRAFYFFSVGKSSKMETQGRRDVCGKTKNLGV